MERAHHISIAMIDNIDINGSAGSKVAVAADRGGPPLGSTVSFHDIRYKVQLRGGILGKKESSGKEILADLKLVPCFIGSVVPDVGGMWALSCTFSPLPGIKYIRHFPWKVKNTNFTQVSVPFPASGLIRRY